MSKQKIYYHAEAVAYLEENAGVRTHGVWRDLERSGIDVYVDDDGAKWTTKDDLNEYVNIYKKKRETLSSRGKKLKDFAPGVSQEWKEICAEADRRIEKRMKELLAKRKKQ